MSNNPTTQNYKDKTILSALIFLLAAAVLIYFIIMPAVENIKKTKVDTEKQGIQMEKDYQAGKSLKKLAENLKIIEPQINALDQIFIKEDSSMDFINTLENVAKKNSVTIDPITNSTFGAENKPDWIMEGYSQIPMQELTTHGYFSDQINYLSDLETLNYYLNIETLEIKTADYSAALTGDTKKSLTMKISANTYWQN